ncbi:unnamed protein product [Paramecium octaurelia]|uniref:Uncharacterized protein n=1 Tax=Paramecium octaurelia TaxID=43137 RepID=A0A8S1XLU1_PAROT|nr:unnamed protein product [Paramecium octaurelia]
MLSSPIVQMTDFCLTLQILHLDSFMQYIEPMLIYLSIRFQLCLLLCILKDVVILVNVLIFASLLEVTQDFRRS